jgi:hypothetical protein
MFYKSTSPFQILDVSAVTWNTFHTEDPQILGANVKYLIATTTWRRGFVHPWFKEEGLWWCRIEKSIDGFLCVTLMDLRLL